MWSVENEECGKCGVWKMRSVENAKCGKCRVWKKMSYFQFFMLISDSPFLIPHSFSNNHLVISMLDVEDEACVISKLTNHL